MKQEKQNNEKVRNFDKLFNINNLLSQVINFAAYIISIFTCFVLVYLSFIDNFEMSLDWKTLGVFSIAVVGLAWLNWTTWYKKKYEQILGDDIQAYANGNYSIHSRYYFAIKDWTDNELQKKIDKFNEDYQNTWLRWVEHETGIPIEGRYEVEIIDGQPAKDENGDIKKVYVKGIKDLSYFKFKHPIIMWRIKTHHYPKSGYKTALELRSLFSYQEANLNKRHLKADKHYYRKHSLTKLITLLLTISIGASLVPEFIKGNFWSALLKLLLALGSLLSSILMGSINGIRGARIKLSTVEDVCCDLEKWANTKPLIQPYNLVVYDNTNTEPEQLVMNIEETPQVTKAIFDRPNSQT